MEWDGLKSFIRLLLLFMLGNIIYIDIFEYLNYYIFNKILFFYYIYYFTYNKNMYLIVYWCLFYIIYVLYILFLEKKIKNIIIIYEILEFI